MSDEQNRTYEEERLLKINEQMAKLAARKRKIKEAQKKKDEKKRRSSIFAIGELFEHLDILYLDKNIIMGALIELTQNKDNKERMDELAEIGSSEMLVLEDKKDKKKLSINTDEE